MNSHRFCRFWLYASVHTICLGVVMNFPQLRFCLLCSRRWFLRCVCINWHKRAFAINFVAIHAHQWIRSDRYGLLPRQTMRFIYVEIKGILIIYHLSHRKSSSNRCIYWKLILLRRFISISFSFVRASAYFVKPKNTHFYPSQKIYDA